MCACVLRDLITNLNTHAVWDTLTYTKLNYTCRESARERECELLGFRASPSWSLDHGLTRRDIYIYTYMCVCVCVCVCVYVYLYNTRMQTHADVIYIYIYVIYIYIYIHMSLFAGL